VGPAIAARIIEYRELNGPFQMVDDLEVISGISERMVDEMRGLITVGS
jgi:competence protein ComEA